MKTRRTRREQRNDASERRRSSASSDDDDSAVNNNGGSSNVGKSNASAAASKKKQNQRRKKSVGKVSPVKVAGGRTTRSGASYGRKESPDGGSGKEQKKPAATARRSTSRSTATGTPAKAKSQAKKTETAPKVQAKKVQAKKAEGTGGTGSPPISRAEVDRILGGGWEEEFQKRQLEAERRGKLIPVSDVMRILKHAEKDRVGTGEEDEEDKEVKEGNDPMPLVGVMATLKDAEKYDIGKSLSTAPPSKAKLTAEVEASSKKSPGSSSAGSDATRSVPFHGVPAFLRTTSKKKKTGTSSSRSSSPRSPSPEEVSILVQIEKLLAGTKASSSSSSPTSLSGGGGGACRYAKSTSKKKGGPSMPPSEFRKKGDGGNAKMTTAQLEEPDEQQPRVRAAARASPGGGRSSSGGIVAGSNIPTMVATQKTDAASCISTLGDDSPQADGLKWYFREALARAKSDGAGTKATAKAKASTSTTGGGGPMSLSGGGGGTCKDAKGKAGRTDDEGIEHPPTDLDSEQQTTKKKSGGGIEDHGAAAMVDTKAKASFDVDDLAKSEGGGNEKPASIWVSSLPPSEQLAMWPQQQEQQRFPTQKPTPEQQREYDLRLEQVLAGNGRGSYQEDSMSEDFLSSGEESDGMLADADAPNAFSGSALVDDTKKGDGAAAYGKKKEIKEEEDDEEDATEAPIVAAKKPEYHSPEEESEDKRCSREGAAALTPGINGSQHPGGALASAGGTLPELAKVGRLLSTAVGSVVQQKEQPSTEDASIELSIGYSTAMEQGKIEDREWKKVSKPKVKAKTAAPKVPSLDFLAAGNNARGHLQPDVEPFVGIEQEPPAIPSASLSLSSATQRRFHKHGDTFFSPSAHAKGAEEGSATGSSPTDSWEGSVEYGNSGFLPSASQPTLDSTVSASGGNRNAIMKGSAPKTDAAGATITRSTGPPPSTPASIVKIRSGERRLGDSRVPPGQLSSSTAPADAFQSAPADAGTLPMTPADQRIGAFREPTSALTNMSAASLAHLQSLRRKTASTRRLKKEARELNKTQSGIKIEQIRRMAEKKNEAATEEKNAKVANAEEETKLVMEALQDEKKENAKSIEEETEAINEEYQAYQKVVADLGDNFEVESDGDDSSDITDDDDASTY